MNPLAPCWLRPWVAYPNALLLSNFLYMILHFNFLDVSIYVFFYNKTKNYHFLVSITLTFRSVLCFSFEASRPNLRDELSLIFYFQRLVIQASSFEFISYVKKVENSLDVSFVKVRLDWLHSSRILSLTLGVICLLIEFLF